MTTATKPRTRDPKPGVAVVVDRQPDAFTVPHLVLAWAGTAGALNILDETGTPLLGTLRDPGAQRGDKLGIGRSGRRGGNVLDELGGRRVREAVRQHGARVVVVAWATVEAALASLHRAAPNPRDEYERAASATPGGLLAVPGYDEWLADWQAKQQTPSGVDNLEAIRAQLEADIAQPMNVAVVLVSKDDRATNPFFRSGIDAGAMTLKDATAAMEAGAGARREADEFRPGRNVWSPPPPSPYAMPGHEPRTPIVHGRIDGEWGTQPIARPPETVSVEPPKSAAPPWASGQRVTEVALETLAEINYAEGAGLTAGVDLIHVSSERGGLVLTWGPHGRHYQRWHGDPTAPAATETVVAKVREITDVPAGKPAAVIVDVGLLLLLLLGLLLAEVGAVLQLGGRAGSGLVAQRGAVGFAGLAVVRGQLGEALI
jgi:hypothetical protein